MTKKSIALIIAVLLLIIIGMFVYADLKKKEISDYQPPAKTAETEKENTQVPYSNITRIDAKHYFIDGKHTLAGEINFPTPCDLLETKVVVAESYPEQVTVEFNVINNAQNCIQKITPQRFKVDFEAGPAAVIKAVFMGRPIDLNLVPAAPGETPDEFELFIKG